MVNSVEVELPFEVLIAGTPLSLQASAQSRQNWKERVAAATRERLEGWEWLVQARLTVEIIHFADAPAAADIDNIVKPILDALTGVLFQDDAQIDDLRVRRFTPGGLIAISNPTMMQLDAINSEPPCVYIRVDLVDAQEN